MKRRDDLPAHRKFGYAQAVELTEIRNGLIATGLTGVELHFATVRTYEARHANDPTYRERQQEWLSKTKPFIDPCIEALKLIRDGHNDARELARITLEAVGIP